MNSQYILIKLLNIKNTFHLKQLKHNYDDLSYTFDQIQEILKRTQVELTQKTEESKQIQEVLNIIENLEKTKDKSK